MSSKLNKSWEQIRTEVHSPEGVESLKRSVKAGLFRKYSGLIESMFRYEYGSDRFDDMRVMSQDTAPEKFLFRNGECVWFLDDKTNQIHSSWTAGSTSTEDRRHGSPFPSVIPTTNAGPIPTRSRGSDLAD